MASQNLRDMPAKRIANKIADCAELYFRLSVL